MMAENEVIPTLTQDERTVLMIAESGVSMMAIGRWEPTVKALIQKGLMRAADEWNVYITSDGRKAIDAVEKAMDAEVVETMERIKVAEGRKGFLSQEEVSGIRIHGLSVNQIDALAHFYTQHTGKRPEEICPP